ncbi:MAG TPA: hypothetical protein VJQ52_03100 [Steroidobacteraceae bacterium]|nr:hypothetical protein [Steroidobacteraceae bacterium]
MWRRISSVALLVCIFVTSSVPAASPQSDKWTRRTYQAQQLLDSYYGNGDNIVRAQTILNEVLTANPDFVPAQLQGVRLTLMGGHIVSYEFASGALQTARAMLLRAVQLEPRNPEVHVLLGHLHFLEEDAAAALDSLNTASELKSENPWLNNDFGNVYFAQGDWARADEYYKLVERLGPGNTPQQRRALVHALTKRQQVASQRDDPAEVQRLGKLATAAAAPEDAWTWGEVGNVLFVEGFFDEAIRNDRKAISIMSYGVGRQNLALALYGKWAQMKSIGLDTEAEQYFAEADSLLPLLDNFGLVQERFHRSARSVIALGPLVYERFMELQHQQMQRLMHPGGPPPKDR